MPDDGGRPRKRQRASKACHRCRSKKFRCDATGPPCGSCQTAQVPCSYDDATVVRRRGLKPGYVKILESLWGSVFQSIPGGEDVALRLLSRLPDFIEPSSSDHAGSSPLETWRTSPIPAAIDTLLDGGTLSPTARTSLQCNEDSPTITTWSLPLSLSSEGVATRPQTTGESSVLSSSQRQPIASSQSRPVFSILPELPLDWQYLIRIYLCTEHSWLPLFEKSSLYFWAYNYQEQASTAGANLERSHRGNFASLWATFVLAELHLNGVNSERIGHLEHTSKSLLATVETIEPDFTYSLAFLLRALIYTGRRSLVLARMMLAQAIILNGAHTVGISPAADKRQALVHNGCFVVDVLLALATESQLVMKDNPALTIDLGDVGEWDPFVNLLSQKEVTAEPGPSAQAPPSRTGSVYTELVKLMSVLKSAVQNNAALETSARELDFWKTSLPTHLQRPFAQQAATSHEAAVPSQSNLHLWYIIASHKVAEVGRGPMHRLSPEALPDGLQLRIAEILDVSVRCYGLKMLPSTTSLLIGPTRRLDSHSYAAPISATQQQLVADFANHWGWPVSPFEEIRSMSSQPSQQNINLPDNVLHQAIQAPVIDPSLTASHDLLDYLTMFETNHNNDTNFMEPLGFFPP